MEQTAFFHHADGESKAANVFNFKVMREPIKNTSDFFGEFDPGSE